ncbi:hypothetical protein QBC35DRAFT_210099 [Podospora australis]|uniref:Origin recognition complex subunit 2 n=1 Tax=Podospora australis TaxID=1536484 RepID=A0AAN7AJE8_9PEZI|nr:hypothetical protein QBC35DRAFT_210099 [Podospora australis]
MVRKTAVKAEGPAARASRKRQLQVDPYEVPDDSDDIPKRRKKANASEPVPKPESVPEVDEESQSEEEEEEEPAPKRTPSKRQGRPPKSPAVAPTENAVVKTPSALRQKNSVQTPVKLNGINGVDTPSRRNIADRSARRKSARALVDRVISGAISDDEAEEGDIAREIYESSEDGGEDEEEADPEPTTPSKSTTGRKRKAAASTTRKRSPTPPRDLPPHEQYFYQNKPGLAKTSNNNLSSLDLLTHEEYFSLLRQYKNPHEPDVQFLQSLHAESFPQWAFELSRGFSTCLYGYGSKRRLLHNFATYLSQQPSDPKNNNNKIVMINGYVRTLTIREVLATLSTAILPPSAPKLATGGGNPTTHLRTLLSLLSASSSKTTTLTILINSIDAPALRKPTTQSLLSQLAAHPQIHLCCSADSPDFSLLWDSALRSAFNFVFHDCTTFDPFGPELDVVDEVHELLGRKARRVGGKEGVAFVLRSLPENAKNLFRLLVGEVLVAMDEQGGGDNDEVSVEYRMVYNKAVEEFICSSEMAFRTLLKEFHDHQIITSHKDSIGTELLSLPFRKEELESILEELMS